VDLPVIGIYKDRTFKGAFITVRKWQIDKLVEAGSDYIAIDCTRLERPEPLEDLFKHIRKRYPDVGIVADIADLEDAIRVSKLKPDFISTTLSGYTEYTKHRPKPDIELIKDISSVIDIPVIAEGNYKTPQQVRDALINGAYAVVVGSIITRPQVITAEFVNALKDLENNAEVYAAGFDIGGTFIRAVKIDMKGNILEKKKIRNPQEPQKIFEVIARTTSDFEKITHIGIAAAGRIDFETGKVTYASENIKNWSGVNISKEVKVRTGICPVTDNDVNAAAFAQWLISREENLFMVTLGTGLGGAFVRNGEILRGKNGGAVEIGHLIYPGNDKRCTCGKSGCIETILSGRILLELINEIGETKAFEIISERLAWLLDTAKALFDFDKAYIGGVLPNYGDKLLKLIQEKYSQLSPLNSPNEINFSSVGEYAGAIGAAYESLRWRWKKHCPES
ncbi:MAG: ROK family protein, partial [Thermotogaceae bacterium]|nr:ROK family protein [Thermotogaceae bacterium]